MFWVSTLTLTLSTLVVSACCRPSASGWQDTSIPSSLGSSGWQDTTIPSSLGSSGWQSNSIPSSSGNSGWQDTSSPSSSGGSGWQDASSGWKSGSSGWKSGSSGWDAGSSHNFYDSTVSKDYISRYHGPIALPVVLPDGTIADTPEVSAAKADHLAALEKAKVLWYGPKDDGSYDPHKYEHHDDHGSSTHGDSSHLHDNHSFNSLHSDTHGPQNTPYHGPLATAAVLPSGYLADTPDVEVARAAHLSAVYKAEQEAEKWKHQGWKQW